MTDEWRKKVRDPTTIITTHQKIWIFLQGFLIPTAVCYGVNYGVALLAFKNQPPPTLWNFPLPIAGQYGVTAVVGNILLEIESRESIHKMFVYILKLFCFCLSSNIRDKFDNYEI